MNQCVITVSFDGRVLPEGQEECDRAERQSVKGARKILHMKIFFLFEFSSLCQIKGNLFSVIHKSVIYS